MMGSRSFTPLACGAAIAALAVVLSACGGGGGGASAESAAVAATIAVKRVGGVGSVLVDRRGAALYTPDQEADGKIHCTGPCGGFWLPLAAGPRAPTAAPGVTGALGVIKRPDGRQVTYEHKPLYRFSEDKRPGQVTGDGFTDSFAGTSFTWHAVTTTGASSGGASGSRGYGY
jgi:predicted lipoprotein with Yx(FWY)xxD motif